MKQKYEESLKNCILLARIIFFTMSADISDKYQSELSDKIFKIQCKLEHDRTAGGFIGGRYSVKAWKNMQNQKCWTLWGELYSIRLYWKKKRT